MGFYRVLTIIVIHCLHVSIYWLDVITLEHHVPSDQFSFLFFVSNVLNLSGRLHKSTAQCTNAHIADLLIVSHSHCTDVSKMSTAAYEQ